MTRRAPTTGHHEHVIIPGLVTVPASGNDRNRSSLMFQYVLPDGSLAFPESFEIAYPFCCGLARVVKNDKVGFVDTQGRMIVPFQWDAALDFSEGVAAVRRRGTAGGPGGEWGYIYADGTLFIEPRYAYAGAFREGVAAVNVGGKFVSVNAPVVGGIWGFVDLAGHEVWKSEWQHVRSFAEGFAAVRIDGRTGFVDRRWMLRIPAKYEYVSDFCGGFALVGEGDAMLGTFSVITINQRGEIVPPPN